MQGDVLDLPWERPGWREDVEEWIRAELELQAIRAQGPTETLQTRPWSLLLRVPADSGVLFFKAIAPNFIFEAELTAALERWHPDCVPPLIAADTARGWLLFRDSGARLRELIRSTRDFSPWLEILPQYARMQMDLAEHRDTMLAFGTPDHRLEILPRRYEEMLANTEVLLLGQPNGLTAAEREQLKELAPQFAEWCAELREGPIPESLDHGDFHDANIFSDNGTYRFIDWGDSCVAHPFFSMRVVLVSVEMSLGLEDYSAETRPLRDAYLDAWSEFGSREMVFDVFRRAFRLAQVSGALKWYDFIVTLPHEQRSEYSYTVPSLLKDFLHADMSKYPYV